MKKLFWSLVVLFVLVQSTVAYASSARPFQSVFWGQKNILSAIQWIQQTESSNALYKNRSQGKEKIQDASLLFDKWYDSYNDGDYESTISYFEQYLALNTDVSDPDYHSAKKNLFLAYSAQGYLEFEKKNWDASIVNYKKSLAIEPNDFVSNFNIWSCYYNKWDYKTSLKYYEIASKNADTQEEKDAVAESIRDLKLETENEVEKAGAPSNDSLSYLQYYLQTLNIPSAWGKVKNSKKVIVAVIDDGININHPDLIGKVWVNPTAKYGESKIINFAGDKVAANLPTGEHGTMIAGIIGAETNNNIGIAGIAKNVEIMPLRVFSDDGAASDDNVIRAMNYAIDNGANIINLSLWWSQFETYSDKFDSVVKRAYDKGIVVVIAAWNWDLLTNSQTGIDLSINPISPVCNNAGKTKYSIGVAAIDEGGYRTQWTNWNGCISYFAPGEWIVSTSIAVYNSQYGTDYNMANGTSFSAPMISGIVALWFNQYGYVSPKIVQECLDESLTKNTAWNYIIDAAKYIDALKGKLTTIRADQKNYNVRIENQKTLDSNSDMSALADAGIITWQRTEAAYRLYDSVLRQEVVGMAMKLWGYTPPTNYSCQNIFQDVSAMQPNSWICRSVELAVRNGIVSSANQKFNPESYITRAEALAILMNAAGTKMLEWWASQYKDVTIRWQINVVNTAFSYGYIDAATAFYPNKNATRGEIFNMAKRILKSRT